MKENWEWKKTATSHAAYHVGRSSTEDVFTFKQLAEKALTSEIYEVHNYDNVRYEQSLRQRKEKGSMALKTF